jgi:hypothetical protein
MKTKSKRKKERANVQDRIRGVFFKCPSLSTKEIRVINVSEGGLGLEPADITNKPAPQSRHQGKLSVGRTVLGVNVQFVHASNQISGFAFVDCEEAICGIIRSFFEAELTGAAMVLLQSKDGPENTRHLKFSIEKRTSFEVKTQNNKIMFFSIGILGNTVEWNRDKGRLELIVNSERKEVGDFMRGQLLNCIKNAEAIETPIKNQIQRVLANLPPDEE